MELHPGNIQDYNNEVIIAGSDAAIGHNPGINESEPVVPTARSAKKIAPPAGTVHRGPAVPSVAPATSGTAVVPALLRNNQQQRQATAYEEEKAALVSAGIVTGLAPSGATPGGRLYSCRPRTAAIIRSTASTAAAQRFSASQRVVSTAYSGARRRLSR